MSAATPRLRPTLLPPPAAAAVVLVLSSASRASSCGSRGAAPSRSPSPRPAASGSRSVCDMLMWQRRGERETTAGVCVCQVCVGEWGVVSCTATAQQPRLCWRAPPLPPVVSHLAAAGGSRAQTARWQGHEAVSCCSSRVLLLGCCRQHTLSCCRRCCRPRGCFVAAAAAQSAHHTVCWQRLQVP